MLYIQWDAGVDLAEHHDFQQIETLLTKYANHLLEKKKTLHAIELYRKANKHTEAAKLLFKVHHQIVREVVLMFSCSLVVSQDKKEISSELRNYMSLVPLRFVCSLARDRCDTDAYLCSWSVIVRNYLLKSKLIRIQSTRHWMVLFSTMQSLDVKRIWVPPGEAQKPTIFSCLLNDSCMKAT